MTNGRLNDEPQDKLLRLRDILGPTGLLPISRSHFYALVAAGTIPKPIKLGSRISVWRRSDLIAFLRNAEKANG